MYKQNINKFLCEEIDCNALWGIISAIGILKCDHK